MTTFKKATKYRVTGGETQEYDLGLVLGYRKNKAGEDEEVTAVLIVAPAHQMNEGYLNDVLRKAREAQEASGRKAPPKLSVSQQIVKAAEHREDERALYAKHVIKGWRNVFDDEGKEPAFSEAECLTFLQQVLDDEMFDRLRAFCVNPDNFRATAAEVLAKN